LNIEKGMKETEKGAHFNQGQAPKKEPNRTTRIISFRTKRANTDRAGRAAQGGARNKRSALRETA